MNRRHVLLSLLLLYSSLALSARAQATAPGRVRTELTTIALDSAVTGLYLFDGGKPVPFRSVTGGIGIPIPYEGPARLVFHASAEAFLPEAEPRPPAARVLLPGNTERVLLLAGHAPDGSVRFKALPAGSDALGAGDYLVFNLSSTPVALRIGEQRLRIDPGKAGRLTDPAWREQTLDQLVVMAYLQDGKTRTYSSVWGHRATRRTFLILADGDRPDDRLRIRRFHDLPPSPESEGE